MCETNVMKLSVLWAILRHRDLFIIDDILEQVVDMGLDMDETEILNLLDELTHSGYLLQYTDGAFATNTRMVFPRMHRAPSSAEQHAMVPDQLAVLA